MRTEKKSIVGVTIMVSTIYIFFATNVRSVINYVVVTVTIME